MNSLIIHAAQPLESPVIFECQGQKLIGMIHQIEISATVGVLIIVGGSQYRVGSHRQFVLLARHLASSGITTMRFDVRGMGDSEGQSRPFQQLDDDIKAAIDYFFESCPTLKKVVLWGLCDAASAAVFYAYQDERVKGLVLLNPWVFTEKGAAKTYLKHYYLHRFISADFWRKVFNLTFNYRHSLSALMFMLKKAITENTPPVNYVDLPTRMRECTRQFKHPILFVLSGNDLTAEEFKETTNADVEWQLLLKDSRISRYDLADADHTFSSTKWRNQVADWTSTWIIQTITNERLL